MENLAKVGSSQDFLDEVKEFLWEGRVNTAIKALEHCSDEHADTFVAYLIKHSTSHCELPILSMGRNLYWFWRD